MGWTTPATGTNNVTLLDEQLWNTTVRDNLLETTPAKVTSKGDIVAATGPNAIVRLGAGGDGTILKADSAEVMGVKWAGDERATHIFFDNTSRGCPPGTGGWGDFSGLSTTIDTTWTSTIMVFCSIFLVRQGDKTNMGRFRINIAGTGQPGSTVDIPYAENGWNILCGRQAEVAPGTVTIKVEYSKVDEGTEGSDSKMCWMLIWAVQE